MKSLAVLAVVLLLCGLSAAASRSRKCRRLRYNDSVMGQLVPCSWKRASGMLCMRRAPDMVVFPTAKQSRELEACGYRSRYLWRGKREAGEEEEGFFAEEVSSFPRKKREAGSEESREFDFDSVDSFTHRNTKYNWKNILSKFIKDEWGKERYSEIDPDVKLWIENDIEITEDSEKGVYRAFVGKASDFDTENSNGAMGLLQQHLERRKEDPDYAWIDVQKIIMEFEFCRRLDYSSVADNSIKFSAPRGEINKTRIESGEKVEKAEYSTQDLGRSNLGMWFYKVSCMKKAGRMFAAIVLYTDSMRFSDVERKVEVWVNNPKTVSKWVNKTQERLVEFIRQEIGQKEHHESGQKCTKYKVRAKNGAMGGLLKGAAQILGSTIFGKKDGAGAAPDAPAAPEPPMPKTIQVRKKRNILGSLGGMLGGSGGGVLGGILSMGAGLLGLGQKETKVRCEPYEIKRSDPVVFDIKDAKIVQDITPVHFKYEVNNWIKDTRDVFVARTITLKQRQNLKAWMRNAMIGEVFIQFRQFLEYDEEEPF